MPGHLQQRDEYKHDDDDDDDDMSMSMYMCNLYNFHWSGPSYGRPSTDATRAPRKTFGGVEGAETENTEDLTQRDVDDLMTVGVYA